MTMKITNIYTSEDHNTFGGILYDSDFDTTYSGTHNIASRIAADIKFDRMCQKKTRKKGE
jgi:hypothetical protein|nr:MAG TPA: hypothetical protein [Caudoviricetes sp.]